MSKESRSSRPVWRATSAAATTPAAGPDSTAMRRHGDGLGGFQDAAVRAHQVAAAAARGRCVTCSSRVQIGGEDRPDIGADGGRAGALELLDLGQHFRREIDRHVRQRRAQPRAEPPLVLRIEEAEQQRDRNGIDPRLLQRRDQRVDLVFSERRDDGAVRADALGDLEPAAGAGSASPAHPGTGRRDRRAPSAAAPARRGSRAW